MLTQVNFQDLLDNEIYPRLDRKVIVQELDPRDKGKYYLVICPECGKREAYLYKNKFKIHCNNENNCGYSKTILEYMNGGEKPTGEAFWEVLEKLGKLTGVEIPKQKLTPQQTEMIQQAQEDQIRIETALRRAQVALTQEAIGYLEKRGIPRNSLPNLDIGLVIDAQHAEDLGCINDKNKESVLAREWTGRIIFGIRDHRGKIRGFVGRATHDNAETKYLNSKGLEIADLGLVGLETALRSKEIVVVEAIIDRYIFLANGVDNVAAIGGSGTSLTPERLQLLRKLGVKRITLLLDNDRAGRRGKSAAVRNCTEKDMPAVYAVDEEKWLGSEKDPGDFISKTSPISVKNWFDNIPRESGYNHLAHSMAEQYNFTNAYAQDDYVRECIEFDATVKCRDKSLQLERHFWPEVCKIAGVDMGFVLQIRDEAKYELSEEERKIRAARALRKSQDALQNGDLQSALSSLHEAYQAASGVVENASEQIVKVVDRLEQHTERLALLSGLKTIGLPQKTLPTLDQATLGLRKMIGLVAAPGVGKTIIMSQFFQDILAHNDDACGLLISWELTGNEILDRMKSRLTKTTWADFVMSSTPELRAEADRKIRSVANRMAIIEQANCTEQELTIEKIIQEAEWLKRDTSCSRCVIAIDYLQIFPVPESLRGATDLQKDDWIVKQMKRLRNYQDNDPLIVISETNKAQGTMGGSDLSKAKGSGRFVYQADAVFFLNQLSDTALTKKVFNHNGFLRRREDYDPAPPKGQEMKELAERIRKILIHEGKDYLELSIAKIRDGGKRKRIVLTNFYERSEMLEGIR